MAGDKSSSDRSSDLIRSADLIATAGNPLLDISELERVVFVMRGERSDEVKSEEVKGVVNV